MNVSVLAFVFRRQFSKNRQFCLKFCLPHSKTIKNPKKLSVFGENDSCRLSNFLQTQIFWNSDHISRIYNQINYRNIWFPKVIIILITTAQVLFFNVYSEKDPHLNPVERNRPKVIRNFSLLSFLITALKVSQFWQLNSRFLI